MDLIYIYTPNPNIVTDFKQNKTILMYEYYKQTNYMSVLGLPGI